MTWLAVVAMTSSKCHCLPSPFEGETGGVPVEAFSTPKGGDRRALEVRGYTLEV
ncbi:hypothetical protein LSAC_01087 [Levilinea saccharolytica]|nr:hypothetical protein LSAC_01087 [Levilinea saccharolytica]